MEEDYVAASKFVASRYPLLGDLAVMYDEFQVKLWDAPAGVAFAARGAANVPQPPPEGKIGRLDRVLQERPVDFISHHITEGGVAFQFGKLEGRTQCLDQPIHQVGQDVLRVIEFDAGNVTGIAGDVGND
jgi:hypothetical protein